jgi:hypothetical protein
MAWASAASRKAESSRRRAKLLGPEPTRIAAARAMAATSGQGLRARIDSSASKPSSPSSAARTVANGARSIRARRARHQPPQHRAAVVAQRARGRAVVGAAHVEQLGASGRGPEPPSRVEQPSKRDARPRVGRLLAVEVERDRPLGLGRERSQQTRQPRQRGLEVAHPLEALSVDVDVDEALDEGPAAVVGAVLLLEALVHDLIDLVPAVRDGGDHPPRDDLESRPAQLRVAHHRQADRPVGDGLLRREAEQGRDPLPERRDARPWGELEERHLGRHEHPLGRAWLRPRRPLARRHHPVERSSCSATFESTPFTNDPALLAAEALGQLDRLVEDDGAGTATIC